MNKVLVTGVAGFIGMHVAQRLLADGYEVIGIDNLNAYYPVALKQARLTQLNDNPAFRFQLQDISDAASVMTLFARERFDAVIHLAAQAGVRYSLENPQAYIQSNLVGFANILEGCRHHPVVHLVYASSSSVYGMNTKVPFSEYDPVDCPVSLYAATKKSNELMAHSYSHLYQIPTTGLRFFTVYGEWGRPDMSPWLFTDAILQQRPIKVFNYGKMQRDFTYIDDIVEGVVRVLRHIPLAHPLHDDCVHSLSNAEEIPYRLYNIGNHQPVELLEFINTLEEILGITAVREYLPMQAGDVYATYADIQALQRAVGFSPTTPLATGLRRFVAWFKHYHQLK